MIIDGHVHIDNKGSLGIGIDQRDLREWQAFKGLIEGNQLKVLANAACPAEYRELSKIEGIYLSFGIHPWHVADFCSLSPEQETAGRKQKSGGDQTAGDTASVSSGKKGIPDGPALKNLVRDKLEALEGIYRQAQAVGEIGMDSVWCSCHENLQGEMLRQQLEIADALNKPVVLHTKGKEQEIAQMLSRHGMKKLVHWYSCESRLEDYIGQNCYFTVGPNYAANPAVQAVIRQVPLNRLLVESDGLSAVRWASGRQLAPEELPDLLRAAMAAVGAAKQVTLDRVEKQMEENFHRLLGA